VQVLGYRIAFREQGMSLSMASMVVFAIVVLVVVIAFQRSGRERRAAG
jgi:hypothetical protein